jgi:ABC-type phosphate transport system substrate-binding protein
MRTTLIAALCLLGIFVEGISAAAQTDGFIVVIHATNRTESLTQAELSRIFLRRDTHWVDSRPVFPVDQPRDSEVRSTFTKEVHGRTVGAVNSYWQQQIFSGGEIPPSERATDQAVLEFVRTNPDAIGYVRAGTPLGQGVVALALR